jgi:hypothetical protein
MSEVQRLAFGCSTLADHASARDALRVLDAASDLGIRHFDTARAYGLGRSEELLGRHVRGRRDEFLITTKHGLAPPISNARVRAAYDQASANSWMSVALQPARRVRRALRPSLFSPRSIRAGIEASLTSLGTDFVDYFLLHEATAGDAAKTTVQETLDSLVREGKVRQYGLGSAFDKLSLAQRQPPPGFHVLQFEHGVGQPVRLQAALSPDRDVFTHSALRSLDGALGLLAGDPALAERHSAALGVDVGDRDTLPGLLLGYSHLLNRAGKVVFSTRTTARLEQNVGVFNEVVDWPADRAERVVAFGDELAAALGAA